ncbi:MAG: hypothetical protein Kow00121_60460 [Elainellaceae cyanobacterium]
MQMSDSMQIRYSALIIGVVFLLLGLAGFAPTLVSGPATAFPGPGYGYLFGIFPTNYFHNAIGVLVGLWGLAAFTNLGGAITFNRIFAIVYSLNAIFGLLPFAKTLFGTMPLYGNNVWLSALTALVAAYYGYIKAAGVDRTTGTPTIV